MIDLNKYLESGAIEDYCLGILSPEKAAELEMLCREHPEVREELERNQEFFQKYIAFFQHKAPSGSKEVILQQVEAHRMNHAQFTPDGARLTEFIPLSKNSNVAKWQDRVRRIKPAEDYENLHIHTLYFTEQKQLYLVWVKKEIPPETHPEVEERFLVLEGTCDCIVEGEVFAMKAGSYMEIPQEGTHQVRVTSKKPVKGILSKIIIAA